MNITARTVLSTLVAAAFVLMAAALSMGVAGTGDMADDPGLKTVIFGVT